MKGATPATSRNSIVGVQGILLDRQTKLARSAVKGRHFFACIALFAQLNFSQVSFAQKFAEASRSESEASQPDASDLLSQAPVDAPEAHPDEVTQWLAELDSDRYAIREAAQRHLQQARSAALEGVAEIAQSRASLESSWRAVNILLEWSRSGEESLRLEALKQIAQLTDYPLEAATAHEQLASIRERDAIEAIKKLGGRVQNLPFGASSVDDGPLQVILGPEWQGGIEDLRQIGDVRRAKVISLWSAPLGDEGVLEIAKSTRGTSVARVEFYGLKLSENAIAQAGAEMPGIHLEVHRGNARLGISGVPAVQGIAGVPVQEIVPNSAAAKAGLQPGDLITHIDAERVTDFTQLTQLIGAHSGGDEVELTVERGQNEKKTLKLRATLDSWGANDPDPEALQNPRGGVRILRGMPIGRPGQPIPPGFPLPQQPGQQPPQPQLPIPPQPQQPGRIPDPNP